eukprot:CCRYP_013785-RB/>CCRYP_013785-RB protein AED:0.13 eAED:-0.04 QI:0/-1/0/1/-1/1/1/0/414
MCRKGSVSIFEEDLTTEGDMCWMNADEFLCKYRVTRNQLDQLTNILSEDDVFAHPKRGYPQMPVKHQLMVWLHFIGHEAQSNSTQRDTFKVSRGMCEKARDRIVKALNNIRNDYIRWPGAEERKEIAARIKKEFHIPNCPIMQDGTLLRLGIEPESDDAADYHGRKFAYSITVNVLNDDERRIRAYCAGYPGSAHDNRVWRNMKQHRDPGSYFSENEFIMCDTAYEPSWFCVPAFKCVVGDGLHLHPHKTLFNTVLAKPRVVCEHTMGLWKGRFCWLRNIRMKITNNKNSLKRILRYIDSTIVVHNMLLDWREAEDRNAAWGESVVTDLTSIDDANRAPPIAEREVLDQPIPLHALNDMRRPQLMQYICETYIHSYNYSPIQDDLSLSHGDWSSMVGYDFSTDGDDSSVVSELD